MLCTTAINTSNTIITQTGAACSELQFMCRERGSMYLSGCCVGLALTGSASPMSSSLLRLQTGDDLRSTSSLVAASSSSASATDFHQQQHHQHHHHQSYVGRKQRRNRTTFSVAQVWSSVTTHRLPTREAVSTSSTEGVLVSALSHKFTNTVHHLLLNLDGTRCLQTIAFL